jgi:hypothetical protein
MDKARRCVGASGCILGPMAGLACGSGAARVGDRKAVAPHAPQ